MYYHYYNIRILNITDFGLRLDDSLSTGENTSFNEGPAKGIIDSQDTTVQVYNNRMNQGEGMSASFTYVDSSDSSENARSITFKVTSDEKHQCKLDVSFSPAGWGSHIVTQPSSGTTQEAIVVLMSDEEPTGSSHSSSTVQENVRRALFETDFLGLQDPNSMYTTDEIIDAYLRIPEEAIDYSIDGSSFEFDNVTLNDSGNVDMTVAELTNHSSTTPQTLSCKVTDVVEEQITFTWTLGMKYGLSSTVTIEVPGVGSVAVTVSAELSFQAESSTQVTQRNEKSIELSTDVPPLTHGWYELTGQQTSVKADFTAQAQANWKPSAQIPEDLAKLILSTPIQDYLGTGKFEMAGNITGMQYTNYNAQYFDEPISQNEGVTLNARRAVPQLAVIN